MWKKVRRRDITADAGLDALGVLPGDIGVVIATEDLLSGALGLAGAVDHSVYGCLCVAGARRRDLPLMTADARLVRTFSASPYAASILPLSDGRP